MKNKKDLVCDQCGIPTGECFHSHDYDYMVETKEEFESGLMLFRICSLGILVSFAIIGWFLC